MARGLPAALCVLCIHGFLARASTDAAVSSLRLVHVVFRHGDRTASSTFPTDPNQEDAWPEGFGQLTQLGMRQEYELGRLLRDRYGGFLNATYIHDEVRVESSDYERTLMSAETMLAGLYPPVPSQTWSPSINWQPIPIHTCPLMKDRALYIKHPCPRYEELERQVYSSDEMIQYEEENKELLAYIKNMTGMASSSTFDLLQTFPGALYSEKTHDMQMAPWVTDEIYDAAMYMRQLRMELFVYTAEMVMLRAGRWLYNTLAHMKDFSRSMSSVNEKIFFYSLHDTSVASFLSSMGAYDHVLPEYSAFFALELHEESPGEYNVQLFYKNDTNEHPETETRRLPVQGCPDPCSLPDFESAVQTMLISSDEEYDRVCSI